MLPTSAELFLTCATFMKDLENLTHPPEASQKLAASYSLTDCVFGSNNDIRNNILQARKKSRYIKIQIKSGLVKL